MHTCTHTYIYIYIYIYEQWLSAFISIEHMAFKKKEVCAHATMYIDTRIHDSLIKTKDRTQALLMRMPFLVYDLFRHALHMRRSAWSYSSGSYIVYIYIYIYMYICFLYKKQNLVVVELRQASAPGGGAMPPPPPRRGARHRNARGTAPK